MTGLNNNILNGWTDHETRFNKYSAFCIVCSFPVNRKYHLSVNTFLNGEDAWGFIGIVRFENKKVIYLLV